MQISGTFLNSKLAKRIALMLFVAALVPTATVTWLTHNSIHKIYSEASHKKLIDNSRFHALSSHSSLVFASNSLESTAKYLNQYSLQDLDKKLQLNFNVFKSMVLLNKNGDVVNYIADNNLVDLVSNPATLEKISEHATPNKVTMEVLKNAQSDAIPTVTLIYQYEESKGLLIAEVNPDFIWGDTADYPSDVGTCVYQQNEHSRIKLFCSANEKPEFYGSTEPENRAEWELFMRAEFNDEAWVFVSNRQYPIRTENTSIVSGYRYVGVAFASTLLVALISLIQIRRTMEPLEKLIAGTRKISKGEFAEVEVEGEPEFVELAQSFNTMSSDIQKQLGTLHALSFIDRQMSEALDVGKVVQQVIDRIKALMPDVVVCVMRFDEEDLSHKNKFIDCRLETSVGIELESNHLRLPMQEFEFIKSLPQGELTRLNERELGTYVSLMSGCAVRFHCAAPILWQNQVCAALFIGYNNAELPDQSNDKEIIELSGRIGVAISSQAREDRLLVQAQYDSLTGLPNRILLQDRMKQAFEHSDRTRHPCWVAFVDLDRFKLVNDSLGHKAGDDLLIEVAKRLQWMIRDTDTLSRFGGDEFVIILQEQFEESFGMSLLNRLIKAFESPFSIGGQDVTTTCSIGVAIYPADGATPEALLRNADMAMYRAKELGKNNFQFFTQKMNDKIAERLKMDIHLRKAMQQNELELYYQPKVSIENGTIVGMEALIRWNSEELGFMSPAQFIPLAEETGLILQIGEWAIKEACRQASEWNKGTEFPLQVSVNLSVRQFKQKNLVEIISEALEESGLAPHHLELELTESLLIADKDNILQTLHEIRALGVQLSIDDFGTGYSSLSYLKRLPINTLKIDKTFIDDIEMHTDYAPIVASIIALAKHLNLKVVAEGVESAEQVRYLKLHQCDEIQGFFFSRPERAKVISSMLAGKRKMIVKASKKNSYLSEA